MDFNRVKISTTTPVGYAEALRDALGEAGAGVVGEYTFCSFTMSGQGRFKPSHKARPHIGQAGKLEVVAEEKIEVVCDRTSAKRVVSALKKAHPYEEPIVNIIALIDEGEL